MQKITKKHLVFYFIKMTLYLLIMYPMIYSLSGIEILTEVIFVIYTTIINYYIHRFQEFVLAQDRNSYLSFGIVLIRMGLGFFKTLKILNV